MEEVDKIILHSLRQMGCDIDEEVTSLKQFDTEMIVKSTVSCLELIQPGLNLPQSLPHNMAAKYRVGQMIAQACTDNGYPGDIGYQTFLYSEEADLRKVLMFLIEKLPKEQEKFVHEPTGSELLIRKIKCKVKQEWNRPWLPVGCSSGGLTEDFVSFTNIDDSPHVAWKLFCMNDLPSNLIDKKYLIPTIISLHSRGVLAKNQPQWSELSPKKVAEDNLQPQLRTNFSKKNYIKDLQEYFSTVEKLCQRIEKNLQKRILKELQKEKRPFIGAGKSERRLQNSENLKLKRRKDPKRKPPIAPRPKLREKASPEEEEKQKEEQRLKEEEETLMKEVEDLVQRVQQLKLKEQQMMQELEKDEVTLAEKREKDAVRARILELLPDGEQNVVKLQQVVETAAQRLVSLAAQWEKHRVPLIAEYRKSVQLQSSRMNESVKKAETAKSLSEKRKELELELKSKDQILAQLESENERNGKEVNRSAYTRRILEIINNIEKQKTEIEKVLRETRDIQKEINILSGQLDRSFTVADETIFRDAKKDETSRKAYKLLATLHSDCDQLVAMVQETGAILREIRDLEDQIEKEKSKNISANLERITADLNQMKVESAQLSAQLKLKQENS